MNESSFISKELHLLLGRSLILQSQENALEILG